jgi:hypothetical protein
MALLLAKKPWLKCLLETRNAGILGLPLRLAEQSRLYLILLRVLILLIVEASAILLYGVIGQFTGQPGAQGGFWICVCLGRMTWSQFF